jgi:hypothetical protein
MRTLINYTRGFNMTLEKQQEDEVRKQVIAKFGEESVKKMDFFYMELNDIRMTAVSSYDFLEKVKDKYGGDNTDLVLAALLYGMKMGEVGYEYHLKQMEEAKQKMNEVMEFEKEIDHKKKLDEAEEMLKKKKFEKEFEAADQKRMEFAYERDYQ